jgi:S-formylglutathione hydrolase FrmB
MFRARNLLVSLALAASMPSFSADVVTDGFTSSALGRRYAFTVYLPQGYSEEASRRFPVLYLLHGANGDEQEWLAKGNVRAVLDQLIEQKKIEPLVVVMPGDFGGWWVDGSHESSETALLKELLPVVEERYRVRTDRGGRLIAGSSAGGYAVARFALKYPELFVAGAALSPAVYVDEPPATSSARSQLQFTDAAGHYSKKAWARLNYPPLLVSYAKQSLRVPMYVNAGDHDRYGIAHEALTLFEQLERIQPGQDELRIVGGDHEWAVWAATIGEAVTYVARYLQPAPDAGAALTIVGGTRLAAAPK